MKSSLMTLSFLFVTWTVLFSQNIVQEYIDAYADIAVEEMDRTGIPASIKLAQGLLESDWGRSELSMFAHNHFGIKCGGSWTGRSYYKVDDDTNDAGELVESCFRVFDSDVDSYRAHSEFLLTNSRYNFLFDHHHTDYKEWARGLRKAGYATDPSYPNKLIEIIEKYDLAVYDTFADNPDEMLAYQKAKKQENTNSGSQEKQENTIASVEKRDERSSNGNQHTQADSDYTRNSNGSKRKKRKFLSGIDEIITKVEESGKQVLADLENLTSDEGYERREEVVEVEAKAKKPSPDDYMPDLTMHNGVKVYVAKGGESIRSIANEKGLSANNVWFFNEEQFDLDAPLKIGDRIYLEEKKGSFDGSKKTHQVREGENILDVAQLYGVKVRSLRHRNYIAVNEEPVPGEIIYLNGVRAGSKPKTVTAKSGKVARNGNLSEEKQTK